MAGLLIVSSSYGLFRGRLRHDRLAGICADVRGGRTPVEIGRDWAPVIASPSQEQRVADWFTMLRDARQGPYQDLPAGSQDVPPRKGRNDLAGSEAGRQAGWSCGKC
jgi:hypothetical protein